MYKVLVIVLIVCITSTPIRTEGACGDGWDVFNDEYYDICYKYYPAGLGDYQTVVTACRSELDSSLPTINTQGEQDFLNKLIIKYKMADSVWLDAGIKNKHIVWTDSSSGAYENWITGHPINDSNCVEMVPHQGDLGKWQDVQCSKKNAYMCKRVSVWSTQRSERLIRDNRRVLDEAYSLIAQLKQNQDKHQTEISQLERSQVPVGFIYVQLPGQAEPKTLWPAYTWSDVTAQYAGQFFRAEGGCSLAFGKGIQPENSPRLLQVSVDYNKPWYPSIGITPGAWSNYIFSGTETGQSYSRAVAMRFEQSGGEVCPINQSVRIYKRTN